LYPAGRQPDANFIQLVAGCMKTIEKFGYFELHGPYTDATGIRLAAD
jgi:hypothetical protein